MLAQRKARGLVESGVQSERGGRDGLCDGTGCGFSDSFGSSWDARFGIFGPLCDDVDDLRLRVDGQQMSEHNESQQAAPVTS